MGKVLGVDLECGQIQLGLIERNAIQHNLIRIYYRIYKYHIVLFTKLV